MLNFYAVKGILTIAVWIAIIIVLLDCPKTKGRTWLLSFSGLSLGSNAGFMIMGFLRPYFGISGDMMTVFSTVLNAASLAAIACLLAFVLDLKNESKNQIPAATTVSYPQEPTMQPPAPPAGTASDTDNPLHGIKGWLKMIVVVNLYIGPALFVIGQLISWTLYIQLAHRYPGVIVVGLITAAGWGYIVYRGIQVARDLRDIKPRAVQNARFVLKLSLAWALVSIPIQFLSGLDPERLVVDAIKTLVTSSVSFAIWYSYFNCSRRVEATYPDWKA
ncbi:MAG TPA: hypothetical protein VK445_06130 [Dissulfurispiraceae bacterium]|nr:hypothetical protein [Dissulfurispiraceae bacterium]